MNTLEGKILTSTFLLEKGFVVSSQSNIWIDFSLGDLTISSETKFNVGGFHYDYIPINFEWELEELIKGRTYHGFPVDYVNEAKDIFKSSTGKILQFD